MAVFCWFTIAKFCSPWGKLLTSFRHDDLMVKIEKVRNLSSKPSITLGSVQTSINKNINELPVIIYC